MRGPRPLTPGEIEASLIEWGAEFREPPLPDQLLVWEPKQFVGAIAYLSEEQWWEGVIHFGGNCLKQTRPQTRAAIYETAKASRASGTSAAMLRR